MMLVREEEELVIEEESIDNVPTQELALIDKQLEELLME